MRPFLTALTFICGLSTPALGDGKSIIVLDASGSMWGQIEGRAKLEIAREALGQVLASTPADSEIGLMAYGHRSKGDCADIELVVAPGKGTAGAISSAANAMKFLGKTPLSDAVRKAAEELRYTEEKANVILITDGIETCNADPCALGQELEAAGVDFTAHVVGFGLSAEEGKSVACLAENTGGSYIQASDASSLVDALKTTVVEAAPAPEPEPAPEPVKPALKHNVDPILRLKPGQDEPKFVIDATFEIFPLSDMGLSQKPILKLYATDKGNLPPGKYRIRAKLHEATAETEFEATADTLAEPELIMDAGILRLRVLAVEGGDPDNDAFFEITGPGEVREIGYGKKDMVLPAQEYALDMKLGSATASQSVVVEAGQDLIHEVVLGIGVGAVQVTYDGSQPVDDGDLRIFILAAKADIAGKRAQLDYKWGNNHDFDLPPGDYLLRATLDGAVAEQPISIALAERNEVSISLNAGVAAFLGTGGNDKVTVLSATKDIAGNRTEIIGGWGPDWQAVLSAGDYIAHIKGDRGESETPFTVKSGERIELTFAPAAP
ncbi:VWA domain-containing protein [Xinfangfangia sp. CPCC 101601]|uniref:VWA domain-containing protein n=1 Tax=Pseudogemmobacter lacusdianii TaxID=3069608 RepID=A0ABU0VV17_9RHOB|nr:VWA domain-containing protein [Xinfangfangia sp. CPCC 101601]MDQ2065571.1 VWA domain-containing protein [Xinfangfangia sp. CPCC 101601]